MCLQLQISMIKWNLVTTDFVYIIFHDGQTDIYDCEVILIFQIIFWCVNDQYLQEVRLYSAVIRAGEIL